MKSYCEGCKNDFICYRNLSCKEYNTFCAFENAVLNGVKISSDVFDDAKKYAPDKICKSCNNNKPLFCRHRRPKCIEPQMGFNICKNCVKSKVNKCLRLQKCILPRKPYFNCCNICYTIHLSINDYRKHIKSQKHRKKAEKIFSDLSFHEHKELMRCNYLKPSVVDIDDAYEFSLYDDLDDDVFYDDEDDISNMFKTVIINTVTFLKNK